MADREKIPPLASPKAVRGYHGSPVEGLDRIRPSERGPLGPAAYLSPNNQVAGRYGQHLYEADVPNIFHGLGSVGFQDRDVNPYEVWRQQTAQLLAAADPDKREELAAIASKMHPEDGYPFFRRVAVLMGSESAAQDLFKRAGFDGISGHIDGPEVAIFYGVTPIGNQATPMDPPKPSFGQLRQAIQIGDDLGYGRNYSLGLLKFGQEGMTPEAKAARASAQGASAIGAQSRSATGLPLIEDAMPPVMRDELTTGAAPRTVAERHGSAILGDDLGDLSSAYAQRVGGQLQRFRFPEDAWYEPGRVEGSRISESQYLSPQIDFPDGGQGSIKVRVSGHPRRADQSDFRVGLRTDDNAQQIFQFADQLAPVEDVGGKLGVATTNADQTTGRVLARLLEDHPQGPFVSLPDGTMRSVNATFNPSRANRRDLLAAKILLPLGIAGATIAALQPQPAVASTGDLEADIGARRRQSERGFIPRLALNVASSLDPVGVLAPINEGVERGEDLRTATSHMSERGNAAVIGGYRDALERETAALDWIDGARNRVLQAFRPIPSSAQKPRETYRSKAPPLPRPR
jgi:hypothetical protein